MNKTVHLKGAHSEPRAAKEFEIEMVMALKEAIEEKTGKKYIIFEVINITTQVVASTEYWVKINV